MKADLPALHIELDKLTKRMNAFASAGTLATSTAARSQVPRHMRSETETGPSGAINPIPSHALPAWHVRLHSISATSRFTDVQEADARHLEELLKTDGEVNLVLPPVWPTDPSHSSPIESGATATVPIVEIGQCDTVDPMSVYLNWPA